MHLNLQNIDKTWTIFLDRDGVINHEKENDYIHSWDEFEFYKDAAESFKIFAEKFKQVIVVTNQRGIGKGVTLKNNVEMIHQNMQRQVALLGGRIDKVYFCPDLESSSPNRKPNAGMAFMAKQDFPEIDFTKSIMVGNNFSDMEFGKNIGAVTVFLTTTNPGVTEADNRIDLVFDSLQAFAKAL